MRALTIRVHEDFLTVLKKRFKVKTAQSAFDSLIANEARLRGQMATLRFKNQKNIKEIIKLEMEIEALKQELEKCQKS